jgi:hypothetical protein
MSNFLKETSTEPSIPKILQSQSVSLVHKDEDYFLNVEQTPIHNRLILLQDLECTIKYLEC